VAFALIIDTTAPAPPTLTGFSSDTGVGGDGITNDTTLAIAGTAEPGSSVAVFADGVLEGNAVAATDGTWSFALSPKSQGTHIVAATAQDVAANTSSLSTSLVVVIDTTSPTPPVITGFVTDTGVIGDHLTSDSTLSIAGTAEPGSTITVSFGDAPQGTTTAASDGAWTFDAPSRPDGVYNISATAQDAAGNVGGKSNTLIVTIDTTAPSATVTSFATDTGVLGDYVTRDNTLAISGTAEPGSVVTVFLNGVAEGGTATAASGSWILQATPKPDGVYLITASARDAAGNTAPASGSLTVTIDTTAPDDPTILGFGAVSCTAGEQLTNTNTLNFFGVAAAGSTVSVFLNGVSQGTSAASSVGTWSFLTALLPDGQHTATVIAQDAAGNISGVSNACVVTIDATQPVEPQITGFADDTGLVGDKVTRDNTLAITGTAEANSRVTVFFNGVAEGTTVADNLGNWSYAASAKADGLHTITASAQDAAGNTSGLSNACVVTIDTTGPAATTITAFSDDTGVVGDKITRDNTLRITGTAEANSRVTVFFNGVTDGTTIADAAGNWSYAAGAKADGSYTITASAQDAADNTGGLSNECLVTIDTTAPAATTITAFSDDTGVVGDKITRDNTLRITGTAEANSRVTVFFDGVAEGTTVADALGNWSYNASAKADGLYTITASAQDAAGNTGGLSNECMVTIDTTGPAATTITAFSDDTGVVGDKITRDNTLTITGTAEANSLVTVLFDGVADGTTIASALGNWSYFATAKADGLYTITASARDAAGNTGGLSNECLVTIDTTGPAATTITAFSDDTGVVGDKITRDNTLAITGTAEANSRVTVFFDGVVEGTTVADALGNWAYTASAKADGLYRITASAQDAAGNTGGLSNECMVTIDTTGPAATTITAFSDDTGVVGDKTTRDNTLTITGTAEAHSRVTVFFDGVADGTTTTDAAGNWAYNASAKADGSYSITASAQDAAGNTGGLSNECMVTIDTTGPAATTITAFSDDTGVVGDKITRDNTLAITGTAEANSRVTVFFDGVAEGATVADNAGNWAYTASAKADGSYTITASAQDAAGNAGGLSNECLVTIDTTGPAATTITAFSDDTGVVGDKITRDNTLAITGTAEANSQVTVFFNGVADGTTTADAAGNWAYNASAKTDGSYTITASAQDAAGNTGGLSNECMVTIDTTSPAATTITAFSDDTGVVGDKITRDNTLAIIGTAEANSQVTVFFNGVADGTTTADAAGNWAYNATAKADGSYTITASAQDAAGNTGGLSNECMVTIDTTGPAATTINGFSEDTGVVGDKITRDNTLTITGTAEPNSQVTVFFDGAADGTTTADDTGNWSYDASSKPDGSYTITAIAEDAAGNVGGPSNECEVTIDTVGPAAPLVASIADDSNIVGDLVTNDNTLNVTGTAAADALVEVSFDGVVVGTTLASAAGEWSFDAPAMPDGVHRITASTLDAAGNATPSTNGLDVTIDTVAPLQPFVTTSSASVFQGAAEPNSTLTAHIGTLRDEVTTTASDGSWHIQLSQATVPFDVTFDAMDLAGNRSPGSPMPIDDEPGCGSPIVDTDFNPVTGSASSNSLLIVRERAYEVSSDLAAYGAPGTHTYVQSLLFHTRDEESDREVIAATITFSPGVTIVTTITSSKLLGGTKHDGVGTYSDAMFGIFDNPGVANPNWNKYSGSPRGLDAAKDHRFEVINDGRNGEAAKIELQFPTTTGPDQSRVIVDYGDCWAVNPTVSIETHAPAGKRARKYARYEHFRIGDKTYRASTTEGAPLHYIVPTIERISQDLGSSGNDHVTSDSTLDLFGRSSPGARVSIELDGAIVDEVLADGQGRWSYLLPSLSAGNYGVRATSEVNGSELASSAFRFSIITSDVLA
jgi:uncharacterized protein YegJ (DUF2314 family)